MLLSAAVLLLQATSPVGGHSPAEHEARAAQARFEVIHRMNLPRVAAPRITQPCRTPIGRMCYWHDSTDVHRPPEAPVIAGARARLIATLDSLGGLDPRSEWIAGQRVRYRIEAEQWNDAVRAARDCAATAWWCAALRGLALHAAGRYVDAESAFAAAYRDMPRSEQCRWTDIRPLLWPRAAHALDKVTCAERAASAERLWRTARPMWSAAGNDLRSEHFARETMARIRADARDPQDADAASLRESLVRYGWPAWYSRDDDRYAGAFAEPGITSHDHEPSFAWIPDAAADATRVAASGWRLHEEVAPSRYASARVSAVLDLPHQLARLPAGDSMRVLVRYAITDTAMARDRTRFAVAYLSGDSIVSAANVPPAAWHESVVGGAAVLRLPDETTTVSLELYGEGTHRLARARYTIDGFASPYALSDLVLFDADSAGAEPDLSVVARHALVTAQFPAAGALGVAWQLRAPRERGLVMRLRLAPKHVSGVRRLATRLHLVPEPDVISVRWSIPAPDTSLQTMTLRLPAGARGWHRLTLSVEAGGGTIATSSRDVDLVRDR